MKQRESRRNGTPQAKTIAPPARGSSAPAGSPAAQQAAAILLARAEAIVDRWARCLRDRLYLNRALNPAELRDHAPALVRSLAGALLRGQAGKPAAPLTRAATAHARIRLAQGIPLDSLLREYQLLRSEIWRTLSSEWSMRPGKQVAALAGDLDRALDTLAIAGTTTYGGEMRRIWSQIEGSLRASQARFHDLVESSGDWVWEVDARGIYTYTNSRVQDLLGYAPEQVLGRTPFDLMPADEARRLRPLVERAFAAHEPLNNLENVNLTRDGRRVVLETSGTPFFDAAGRLAGYRGIDRDITARKRAELEVRANEARFRDLVETTHDMVWEIDPEGVYTYVSPQVVELMGYTPEEVLGRVFFDFMPPEEARRVREGLQEEVTEHLPIHDYENVYLRKDGRRIVVETTSIPVYDNAGDFVGYRGTHRDITARKQAEQERERLLAEAQRWAGELDATLASMADGLIIYGANEEIVRTNAAVNRILGLAPAARAWPTARQWRALHPERADGTPIMLQEAPGMRALQGHEIHEQVMVLHPAPERTVWILASAAPIRIAEGRIAGAIVTFSDITALHQLEEQRDDILRAVSHDLRSPLTVILGQAELLHRNLEKLGINSAMHAGDQAILTSARRMNAMIQDLVDSARAEAGKLTVKPAPVNLNVFLRELLPRLAGAIQVERITTRVPVDLPPVLADIDRLERILVNLLSNAIKYSAPGTPVTVTAVRRAGDVVISVADRGPGIPPEQLPRLFQRYVRTPAGRASREGLGLGLYISRQLVEAQGGRIWAESEVGVGSTFSFSLPVA